MRQQNAIQFNKLSGTKPPVEDTYTQRHIIAGMMNKIFFLLIFILFASLAVPSDAADSPASHWVKSDYTEVRLVSAVTNVGNQKQVPLGLHFKLKKGWKIYWRSPGDAGFPPRLNWAGSKNLAAADIQWPAPKRFSILGFDTQGYKDEVVFPLQVTLLKPGEAATAQATLDYLACKEICIPYKTDLTLTLPAGPSKTSPFAHLINRFQSLVPGDGSQHGIKIKGVYFTDAKPKPTLTVIASSVTQFTKPDLFVEGSREIQFGKPRITLASANTEAQFKIPVFGLKDLKGGTGAFVNSPVTLTLTDGMRSAEQKLNIAPQGSNPQSARDNSNTIWQIVLFALLGGLILNLMPCVLPVLSIKLLGVVSHGGKEARPVRLSFIASSAGIIFSFLLIAAGLLLLKSAGMSIGWGIQFQHPWFLIMMAVIVTLFACNLWGFFEVNLPRWIADAGDGSSHVQGLGGHFSTGMLATLLATPCSAPFLGTAIGFALSRGAFEIWVIFTALGIGLALPYLLVAGFPSLATRLPRPGPWMVILRKVLGFALAATAIWLLSVLASLIGLVATGLCALLLTTVTVILFFHHRNNATLGQNARAAVAALALLAFIAPIWLAETPVASTNNNKDTGQWVRFDESQIRRLVSQGKTVFVDVTADWCITCQVNKSLVLNTASMQAYFKDNNVTLMKADWTRPNETIAQYLAKFGRYGIPFNAVYGPGTPNGIALPELLSNATVQQALNQARPQTKPPATAAR